jgi:hypothetical protein
MEILLKNVPFPCIQNFSLLQSKYNFVLVASQMVFNKTIDISISALDMLLVKRLESQSI